MKRPCKKCRVCTCPVRQTITKEEVDARRDRAIKELGRPDPIGVIVSWFVRLAHK